MRLTTADKKLATAFAGPRDFFAARASGNHLAERLRELYDYCAASGTFTRKSPARGTRVGERVGHIDSKGYLAIRFDGKTYRAHQLAWLHVHGEWPSELDHINRDKTDARL